MPISEPDQKRLIDAAMTVRKNAYARYSDFRVGAAILTKQDEIIIGCNVENASYGLSLCAERGAIMAMIAAGMTEIRGIAIVSTGAATPCGACRQVLAEFGLDFDILLIDSKTDQLVSQWTMSDLLPGVFKLD